MEVASEQYASLSLLMSFESSSLCTGTYAYMIDSSAECVADMQHVTRASTLQNLHEVSNDIL